MRHQVPKLFNRRLDDRCMVVYIQSATSRFLNTAFASSPFPSSRSKCRVRTLTRPYPPPFSPNRPLEQRGSLALSSFRNIRRRRSVESAEERGTVLFLKILYRPSRPFFPSLKASSTTLTHSPATSTPLRQLRNITPFSLNTPCARSHRRSQSSSFLVR